MKTKMLKLTKTELNLLDYLLMRHIEDGSYFGQKKQHYKMCERLELKINDALYDAWVKK